MAAFAAWTEKAGTALIDGLPFLSGSDGKCAPATATPIR
jgi:hypothetical protein